MKISKSTAGGAGTGGAGGSGGSGVSTLYLTQCILPLPYIALHFSQSSAACASTISLSISNRCTKLSSRFSF